MNPAQCANSARAFYLASQRCFERRRISPTQIEGLPVPAIVCAAFSIELGIKALVLQQGGSAAGHDLAALFTKLPPAAQDPIVAATGVPRVQFDAELAKVAKAFVEWRYVYEAQHAEIDAAFLGGLAKAVVDGL